MRLILEFLFYTVVLKYIIAPRIAKWIGERTLDNPRLSAIFQHHQHQFRGAGHEAKSAFRCSEAGCSVLA